MDENYNNGNGNSPYEDPFSELSSNNGQPQPPYGQQPYNQQPYYGQQQFTQHAVGARVKGKPFAIVAFVLAVAAMVCLFSALSTEIELAAEELYAELNSTSTIEYYVENADILIAVSKVFTVFASILAISSDVLVVFAYIGHFKNVRSGNRARYILVFSVLATVLANLTLFLCLITSIVFLI